MDSNSTFRLIWNQTEFLVTNQSENDIHNQNPVDLTGTRKKISFLGKKTKKVGARKKKSRKLREKEIPDMWELVSVYFLIYLQDVFVYFRWQKKNKCLQYTRILLLCDFL